MLLPLWLEREQAAPQQQLNKKEHPPVVTSTQFPWILNAIATARKKSNPSPVLLIKQHNSHSLKHQRMVSTSEASLVAEKVPKVAINWWHLARNLHSPKDQKTDQWFKSSKQTNQKNFKNWLAKTFTRVWFWEPMEDQASRHRKPHQEQIKRSMNLAFKWKIAASHRTSGSLLANLSPKPLPKRQMWLRWKCWIRTKMRSAKLTIATMDRQTRVRDSVQATRNSDMNELNLLATSVCRKIINQAGIENALYAGV